MANTNPQNQFTEGNKHSAKPRKRKTFSEAALRSAAERKSDLALFFYEELFEIKVLEDGTKEYAVNERNGEKIRLADRINAANAWSRLVFIQPKDEDKKPEGLMVETLSNVCSELTQEISKLKEENIALKQGRENPLESSNPNGS